LAARALRGAAPPLIPTGVIEAAIPFPPRLVMAEPPRGSRDECP